MSTLPPIEAIIDNFELLDDGDDRYRYLIELGRTLDPLAEGDRTPESKVQGCVSQVWLRSQLGDGRLWFAGDSDAHITKGLVAVLIARLSGRTPAEILEADPLGLFRQLGLQGHLTAQRSNGLRAMLERMRADARQALAPT